MRKGMLLGAAATCGVLLAGCGGSSDGTSTTTVTRVLVGYVYVTKNDGGTYTGPTAFILPHNNLTVMDPTPGNPNSGDEVPLDKPTSGTIQLAVDGSLTKLTTTTLDFNLAESNEIICSAKGAPNGAVTVSVLAGDPIENGTVVKTLSVPVINLGTTASNNTVLGIQSPSTPTYVPGPADEIRVRLQTTVGLGGIPELGQFVTPAQMMASNGTGLGSGFVAGQVYNIAAAVFDKNGIVITGATTANTSSDATRVVAAGTTLTPQAAQTDGDVVITTTLTGETLVSESFHGMYTQGGAASVSVAPAGPTDLLWAAAGVEATTNLTATVKNALGAVVVGATVNFTSDKETSAASNDWNTGAGFDSLTPMFTPTSGTSNASGQVATVVTAPTSTGALPAGNPAKGHATITATSGSMTGTAIINVTRPLGSLAITGPARMDVGTTSPATGLGSEYFHVTSATDIDNDTVATPTVTWTILNTAIGGNTVGNTGDTSPRSLSVAGIDASTGVVTAGGIAGQATITATSGTVTATHVTEIYGAPAKMILNPDTVVSVIPGATGEYAAVAGTVLPFTFTLQDAYGHAIAFTELNPLTTTSSIQSITGGTITQGGLNVHSFSLTFGSGDGTFEIGTGPITWTGTAGGSATLIGGITRDIGHNGS